MQAFLEYVLRYLVDTPEKIRVTRVEREKGVLYELRLQDEDIGKVVGKQGQTIAAIRNVINSAAKSKGHKIEVEIIES